MCKKCKDKKYFSYHFEKGGEEYRIACCEIIMAADFDAADEIASLMADANGCDYYNLEDEWSKEEAIRTFSEFYDMGNYKSFDFEKNAESV